ncbi:MAG: 2'-5' RNA ligase family protein [Actinomycetales bacterium]|nr:2'-5' RNA ligase family protein [Tetrasphaera sp.]NLW98851.1 2'-5' RNA ligase family protein [Actinomycetales bacterium]
MATIGVAIAVPEPHAATLESCRELFGDPLARAIPAHITILPPTEVDPGQRTDLEDHLRWVCEQVAPFEVHLRGTGTFRPVSPVVFVQLASGISECEAIEAAVRSGPIRRELEFNYHPHVTVAHHLDDEALDHAFKSLSSFETRFIVDSLRLYEHGADQVWRPVGRFAFGLLPD